MIKLRGRIEIKDGGVRVVTGWDLCRYYQWFVGKYYFNTLKTQLPKHGSHISVLLSKFHDLSNLDKIMYLHGQPVDFYIDPLNLHQGRINFWLPAKCDMADFIKQKLNIKDNIGFFGYHLVVCNLKF